MYKKPWLGLLIVIVGVLFGGAVAGGMYKAEAAARTQMPRQPVGALTAPAPIQLNAAAGDETRGREAYDHTCAGCHGTLGNSDIPLHGPILNVYYPTEGVLAGIIRSGYGRMPSTDDRHLSDQDIADIIVYIRTFP
ncbi:MAG: cytochrome c [Chloroflexi bacterium]|nr:cytochrome c [Chloroflexota bacterium]